VGTKRTTPPLGPIVVDTDVLIWYLRGDRKAKEFFDSMAHPQRLLSAIVEMELARGCRDSRELRRLKSFLGSAFGGIAHVSEEISRRGLALVERYTLSHGIAPDDALIAATALTLRARLATANVADYRFISGLTLIPFKPSPR